MPDSLAAIYPDLKGKTFLVTGASSGIGRACAIALGEQGSNVILTGRNEERLQETASHITTPTTLHPCDLAIPEQRDALACAMPPLDGICHAAGIINPFPIRYLDDAQFDKVFNINAKAPILLTAKLLGNKMLGHGASIVFLSSISSSHSMKGGSSYAASKAALEAFSRSIILEHYAKRIRANCLKPGLVDSPLYDQAKALSFMGGLEESNTRYPLGLGTPEDIAAATLFLLSDASRWIAGTELLMDGGLTAGT